MTRREAFNQLLDEMPDDRLDQLFDYARYLAIQDENDQWQRFGQIQFARAYGDDEPEYTLDDIQRGNGS